MTAEGLPCILEHETQMPSTLIPFVLPRCHKDGWRLQLVTSNVFYAPDHFHIPPLISFSQWPLMVTGPALPEKLDGGDTSVASRAGTRLQVTYS